MSNLRQAEWAVKCLWCGKLESEHGPPGESVWALSAGKPWRLCPGTESSFYTPTRPVAEPDALAEAAEIIKWNIAVMNDARRQLRLAVESNVDVPGFNPDEHHGVMMLANAAAKARDWLAKHGGK